MGLILGGDFDPAILIDINKMTFTNFTFARIKTIECDVCVERCVNLSKITVGKFTIFIVVNFINW